jgi:hypothetical protein
MTAPRIFFFTVFLALAWLNPFAPGPSAAMVPWLVSLACVGALALTLLAFENWRATSRWLYWFSAFCFLYFAAHLLWQSRSVEALATLIAWGCVAIMAFAGAALVHLPERLHFCHAQTLAQLWLGIALLSVFMALLQYLRLEHWFAPWISHSSDGAAFANLRQRNQFATLCGIGLLALLYLLRTALRKETVSASATARPAGAQRWQTAWPWLALVALAIGNGLSSSRTGALQWLVIAAVYCAGAPVCTARWCKWAWVR